VPVDVSDLEVLEEPSGPALLQPHRTALLCLLSRPHQICSFVEAGRVESAQDAMRAHLATVRLAYEQS